MEHPGVRLIAPVLVLAGLYWGVIASPPAVPEPAVAEAAAGPGPPGAEAGRLQRLARDAEGLIDAGRYTEALEAVSALRQADPNSHVHLRHLAAIHKGLGRPLDEAAAWEQYLQVAPTPQNACPDIGRAYERAADHARALDAYRRCHDLDPLDADLVFYHARAEERWGDRTTARALYEEGTRIAPEYADMSAALARLYLGDRRMRDAIRLIDAAVTHAPDNVDVLLAAGQVHLRAGAREAARRHLERAIQIDDTYPDLYLLLAAVDEQDGRHADASARYERALALAPDRADVRREVERFRRRVR